MHARLCAILKRWRLSVRKLLTSPSSTGTKRQVERRVTRMAIIIVIIIITNYAKQDGMHHTKGRLRKVLKKKWKNKVMHGQYIRNMDRQLISEEETFLWLSKGDLKAETESEIVVAQDQVLNT
jgi:hypothetical protein